MSIWFGIENVRLNKLRVMGLLKLTIVILIIVTGHYGGMVTHGRDFLVWTSKSKEHARVLPDNPMVFEHLILPVIEEKCVSCHNPDKSKGGLILSDYKSILRGGESGSSIIPGDPNQGEIIRRIHLPLENDDHMPPPERNQLAENEIRLLEGWIAKGALNDLSSVEISPEDPFFSTIQLFLSPDKGKRWDFLPEVDESQIQKLSSDYYTIRRLSENSNALSVIIFPHSNYELQRLSKLKPISKNIIELDLSYLTISDDEVNFIISCESLERLEIDYSTINDAQFNKLRDLKNMRVLKAQGNSLTDNCLETLLNFKTLEKLFIWETGISENVIAQIQSSNPGIDINSGIDKKIKFTSTLPVPKIDPDQPFFIDPLSVRFDHPLKDINILFTLDGKDPGPGASIFSNSLLIDHTCKFKFMASKEGWENSLIDSVMFFKTLNGPDSLGLRYPPDPQYLGKGENALFDLKKGTFNLSDSAWIGFQKNKMVLFCQWEKELILKSITLSSFINTGIHVFPPSQIEVTGGSPDNQERLGVCYPSPIKRNERSGYSYISCPLEPKPITHLLIIVTPLSELPEWHDAWGNPGWFFVDEVILEE
ncbi:MAG: hypothetical protein AMJ61_02250 [Desulfobacterales bacterium SG8_35_2]|nr:MAG: hypothetical protein AMJ61_02250 [Desulfobacterales bacterium SG8_35_2]